MIARCCIWWNGYSLTFMNIIAIRECHILASWFKRNIIYFGATRTDLHVLEHILYLIKWINSVSGARWFIIVETTLINCLMCLNVPRQWTWHLYSAVPWKESDMNIFPEPNPCAILYCQVPCFVEIMYNFGGSVTGGTLTGEISGNWSWV